MASPTELRLPQLAESVTSVTIGAWLKREGDRVEAGEPLVEVETDKTNVELEAPVSGVVTAIRVPEGAEGIAPGALLAIITPVDAKDAPTAPVDLDAVDDPLPPAVAVQPPGPETTPAPGPGPVAAAIVAGASVPATPIARRMASAAGIDLATLEGTGRGGRVSKADVDRVLASSRRSVSASGSTPAPGPRYKEQSLTTMRRVTATRMQQAKQTVPHFYLRVECAVDAVMDLLARAKSLGTDPTPTLTDVVVRAAALALRQVPQANSAWADGALRVYDAVDIAVAVNTTDGLITPIVRAADTKDLGEIAAETSALVTRAREGALTPAEYSGGTFTISNLGMYGVESLYAIVNPPQSCILGVGAATRRPVAVGRDVRVASVMSCTLSADHRTIDGALGAQLLAAVKRYLEQPALMLL